VDRNPRFLPIVLEEQIEPGSFAFTLDYLVDHELDLLALDARFNNDLTGASAYDPRVMLKIVLLAYSKGLISSRSIEAACKHNVQFMAISGDNAPSYTHIAKFIRELGDEVGSIFTTVLLTCDRMGLIGKDMFAIDGVKLPSNASKERRGTHAELAHRAERLDKAAAAIIARHRQHDERKDEPARKLVVERRLAQLAREAQRTREFIAASAEKTNAKGQPLKSNVTDNDSAKMATAKGVIQGYAAQAAVDSAHQIIVVADVLGSGSEQAALLPMVKHTEGLRTEATLITADAGYHSNDNLEALHAQGIEALIADTGMRARDERFADQAKHKAKPDPRYNKQDHDSATPKWFRPRDFTVDAKHNRCLCPAGQWLYSNGSHCTVNGRTHHKFTGAKRSCGPCALRAQCLRHPDRTPVRQVAIFSPNQPSPLKATELMKCAIDSPQGRARYGQRIGTVEPVFANLRHNKRLNRFTLRGRHRVNTQWHLYCLVHNVEKIANYAKITSQ
jgi:transposase